MGGRGRCRQSGAGGCGASCRRTHDAGGVGKRGRRSDLRGGTRPRTRLREVDPRRTRMGAGGGDTVSPLGGCIQFGTGRHRRGERRQRRMAGDDSASRRQRRLAPVEGGAGGGGTGDRQRAARPPRRAPGDRVSVLVVGGLRPADARRRCATRALDPSRWDPAHRQLGLEEALALAGTSRRQTCWSSVTATPVPPTRF